MDKDDFNQDDWIKFRDKLKRQSTIQCKDQCELLTLSIHDLNIMKNEFREAYTNLFENSFTNLRRIIQVKLRAIKYSNKYMMCGSHKQPSFRLYQNKINKDIIDIKFNEANFEPIE